MATKKTSSKKTLTKKYTVRDDLAELVRLAYRPEPEVEGPRSGERGTVGWLISELQKFPKDMKVVQGDDDDVFVGGASRAILRLRVR